MNTDVNKINRTILITTLLTFLLTGVFSSVAFAANDKDPDGDTILDSTDNCVAKKSIAQLDSDKDGIGDACDKNKIAIPTTAPSSLSVKGLAPKAKTAQSEGRRRSRVRSTTSINNDGMYD